MKKNKMIMLTFIIVGMLVITSCEKNFNNTNEEPNPEPSGTTMENLIASPSFDWENTQDTKVQIYTKDNQGNPVKGVKVSVKTGFAEEGGQEIISGVTNNQGLFDVAYNFEADRENVVVSTDYLGFIPEAQIPITNGQISFTFGGTRESFKAQDFTEAPYISRIESTLKNSLNPNITINYIGTYNSSGVPDYLEPEGDYISPEFLEDINAALPEWHPVPVYHPEYLLGVNEHNLLILDNADVWVTFVSEGAGYRNVLAYYTYERNSAPEVPEDVTECTVIFPNASFEGSGGGLFSGDKVYLGAFEENTVIGWIIMRDGFRGGQATEGNGLLYSNLELNPEPDITYRQHCVLLYDEGRDLFVISFEDLIRPGGDNDFNDAVFYATANPIENIESGNVQPAYPDPVDTDGDGIYDSFDDYPNDPNLAFDNFYASSELYGTLAFEDLWPAKGDYDFNDLVIDYNFNRISNAQNEVVTLRGKFAVRAIGASFKNGFGFTIEGLNPNAIASVTGTNYTEGYIQTNANGTEAGQTSATIIVFDNAWENGHGNTRAGQDFIIPDTITVDITLSTPIAADDFGIAPFNPFIIVNKNRGKEVHLPNYLPSDLVDESFFGQSFDDTQPDIGKYYKTVDNLPWAVNFPSKFEYPLETISIDLGHLKFIPWVLSNGQEYKDWYKDLDGYRDNSKIYVE